ncbi:MAG: cell division protein BolA [gamma proteobacterium symbiont of Ctena orbiculata]|nr:MAG: cell division protein BolA [gamma proteobacterium symbiont of Ctena orbiculata]PVV19671.1 MAG: cell division protein BolA [gamma proteobacterium symbiont of Ctena orbiculata]
MSVCESLKGYTRKHERLADLFSLLAVALLFGTLYIVLAYHTPIVAWLKKDAVIHVPVAIALLVFDIFIMYMCLNIGATRYDDEEDERCFHTFKGRRSGSGSIGVMFSNWLHHMEQVGKKHR